MSNLFPNILKKIVSLQVQQVRYLPRWSHRRPVRVIPAEEYDATKDTQIRKPTVENTIETENVKINWEQSRDGSEKKSKMKFTDNSPQGKIKTGNKKPLTISKDTKSNSKAVDMLETTIDADGNLVYTKMKNKDSRISAILVNIKSKKEQNKKDLMLLEGKRLIKDALDAGCKLEYILFSRFKEVDYLKPSLPKLGAKLYKMPYNEMQLWSDLTTTPGIMGVFKVPDTESFKPSDSIPLTIICDNVREPNNLGAILRTCSGVGCENVILTKGCVNVWDAKVLRSASGAHFKLHISKKQDWNTIKETLPQNANVYIADNKKITYNSEVDSNLENLEEIVQSVPVIPYYAVNFMTVQHIVLIIGGETEGVSKESYELASEVKGARLNIPLSNDIDSLNTGTALGIIAFEIKKQLMLGNEVCSEYLSSKG